MLSYRALRVFKAVRTGLEPATFRVTGGHSNQLNYQTVSASAKPPKGSGLSKTGCKYSLEMNLSKNPLLIFVEGECSIIEPSSFHRQHIIATQYKRW